MALARVVSFENVSTDRVEELKREMSEGERPEDAHKRDRDAPRPRR